MTQKTWSQEMRETYAFKNWARWETLSQVLKYLVPGTLVLIVYGLGIIPFRFLVAGYFGFQAIRTGNKITDNPKKASANQVLWLAIDLLIVAKSLGVLDFSISGVVLVLIGMFHYAFLIRGWGRTLVFGVSAIVLLLAIYGMGLNSNSFEENRALGIDAPPTRVEPTWTPIPTHTPAPYGGEGLVPTNTYTPWNG